MQDSASSGLVLMSLADDRRSVSLLRTVSPSIQKSQCFAHSSPRRHGQGPELVSLSHASLLASLGRPPMDHRAAQLLHTTLQAHSMEFQRGLMSRTLTPLKMHHQGNLICSDPKTTYFQQIHHSQARPALTKPSGELRKLSGLLAKILPCPNSGEKSLILWNLI